MIDPRFARQLWALGKDIDEWIDVTETDARIDFTHRADRDDARPHKLTFQVVAAMLRERIKKSRVAASE